MASRTFVVETCDPMKVGQVLAILRAIELEAPFAKVTTHDVKIDEPMREWQKTIRCPGCFWCDEAAHLLGKPCCTKVSAAVIEDGKCWTREAR